MITLNKWGVDLEIGKKIVSRVKEIMAANPVCASQEIAALVAREVVKVKHSVSEAHVQEIAMAYMDKVKTGKIDVSRYAEYANYAKYQKYADNGK